MRTTVFKQEKSIPESQIGTFENILKSLGSTNTFKEDVWRFPAWRIGRTVTVDFSPCADIVSSEDDMRIIKAFVVKRISDSSNPQVGSRYIHRICYLYRFFAETNRSVESLSSDTAREYHHWLDCLGELDGKDRKKDEIESILKSFIPFLRSQGLLPNETVGLPRNRPRKEIHRDTPAPEKSVIKMLDRCFFDFAHNIPTDIRCVYLIARFFPSRSEELVSIPLDGFS